VSKRLLGLVALIGLLLTVVWRLNPTHAGPATQPSENNMVTVRVITEDGKLSEPIQQPKIVKTDEEWKKILTPEQFRVLRSSGTERPFCSGFLKNKEPGMYVCAACGLPLFDSQTKFESGTGWPSFYRPAVKENVIEKQDFSHGMVRTEVDCARCDGHLGHVFDDGPAPTGLRYCMNGESLKFVKNEDLKTLAEKIPATQPSK
jgi:methionine-R-sulfoxide reductase